MRSPEIKNKSMFEVIPSYVSGISAVVGRVVVTKQYILPGIAQRFYEIDET